MAKNCFLQSPRLLLVLSLIIALFTTGNSQTPCFDLTYDVTVTEYRTVQKGVNFNDVLSVDHPKFVSAKYSKRVNVYFDEQRRPVLLESINDHERYYPASLKLPLISIYGETTETRLKALTNGRYNSRTQDFTILNQTDHPEFDPGISSIGFLKPMGFSIPTSVELGLLLKDGWKVDDSAKILKLCKDLMCITIDKINLTITEEYLDEDYVAITYYKQHPIGDIIQNHKVETFKEFLTNDLCSQVTIITSFQNFSCGDELLEPRTISDSPSRSLDDLMAYPNPTNGLLYLEIPVEWKNEEVEVVFTNSYGQMVFSKKMFAQGEKFTFNIGNIFKTEGMYFIRMVSGDKSLAGKFYFTQSK